jgi:hypothetical protein
VADFWPSSCGVRGYMCLLYVVAVLLQARELEDRFGDVLTCRGIVKLELQIALKASLFLSLIDVFISCLAGTVSPRSRKIRKTHTKSPQTYEPLFTQTSLGAQFETSIRAQLDNNTFTPHPRTTDSH